MTCIDCGIAERAPGRSRCYPCYGSYRKGVESFSPMRTLAIDIETKPHKSYHFGMWNVNIPIAGLIEEGDLLCFSAKWLDTGENLFFSEWEHGHEGMVEAAWDLLNEADAVVHFYGSKFDIPHLNREFLLAGMTPPSPYKQVDLKLAVAKQFKFASNKLQHVSMALGLAGKNKTDFQLWLDCLDRVPEALAEMELYNRQDTDLLEELYHQLLPWLPQLPNRNLYNEDTTDAMCAFCGGDDVVRDGFTFTSLSKYKRYHCNDCGAWLRASKRESGVTLQVAV